MGMLGFWEWLLIMLVLGWVVLPWLSRRTQAKRKKVVTARRESLEKEQKKGKGQKTYEVDYQPDE